MAHDITQKLTEVLQHWMNGRPHEATWRTIIEVVKRAPIENKKVANDILQFLARQDVQNEYLLIKKSGISDRILQINLIYNQNIIKCLFVHIQIEAV